MKYKIAGNFELPERLTNILFVSIGFTAGLWVVLAVCAVMFTLNELKQSRELNEAQVENIKAQTAQIGKEQVIINRYEREK